MSKQRPDHTAHRPMGRCVFDQNLRCTICKVHFPGYVPMSSLHDRLFELTDLLWIAFDDANAAGDETLADFVGDACRHVLEQIA